MEARGKTLTYISQTASKTGKVLEWVATYPQVQESSVEIIWILSTGLDRIAKPLQSLGLCAWIFLGQILEVDSKVLVGKGSIIIILQLSLIG